MLPDDDETLLKAFASTTKETIEEDEGDLEKKKADSTTRRAATGTDDALATVNELVTLRLDLEDDYNDALVC